MSKKGPKTSSKHHAQDLPDEPPMDPAVQGVQDALEANLTYFMGNIGAIIKRYDEHLEKAVPPPVPAPSSAEPGSSTKGASAAPPPAEATPGSPKKEASSAPTASAPAAAPASPKADPAASSPKEATAAPAVVEAEAVEEETIEIVFPDNTPLLEQLGLLKRESYALSTTFDGIHDWIALNVPDMQKDESAGVQVMGAVIEQLSSLNEAVRGVYALELKYLGDRSDLEQALLKLPQSETLKLSLEVTDNDMWDDVERGWRTLIRVCLIAYSVLAKNMPRLRDPQGGAAARATGMFM